MVTLKSAFRKEFLNVVGYALQSPVVTFDLSAAREVIEKCEISTIEILIIINDSFNVNIKQLLRSGQTNALISACGLLQAGF